jgi:hypothetical protein
MSTEARTRTPPTFASVALAPLTYLERARGRKRFALLLLYFLVLLVAAVLSWRAMSLRRLPDIGEPFDVKGLGTVVVPDDQNAIVLYRQAGRLLKEVDLKVVTGAGGQKVWDTTDWSQALGELKRWVEQNRPALEVWLAGTERPRALDIQPKDFRITTALWTVDKHRSLVRLALLEGSRREQAGDLEGAWTMYRAALRSSRHAGMYGPLIARMIGSAILRKTKPHIEGWVERPALTAALLRGARADLELCAAMTSPVSQAVQVEYFSLDAGLQESLDDPQKWGRLVGVDPGTIWYCQLPMVYRARLFFLREPERSRRILRLWIANILSQCDRPPAERTRLFEPNLPIYMYDSASPRESRRISLEDLQNWLASSELSLLLPAMGRCLQDSSNDLAMFDLMRLEMATRGYTLDQGSPPKTYGQLIGPYLTSLPLGFEPSDPVATKLEDRAR